jgi:hypothetical protein
MLMLPTMVMLPQYKNMVAAAHVEVRISPNLCLLQLHLHQPRPSAILVALLGAKTRNPL